MYVYACIRMITITGACTGSYSVVWKENAPTEHLVTIILQIDSPLQFWIGIALARHAETEREAERAV